MPRFQVCVLFATSERLVDSRASSTLMHEATARARAAPQITPIWELALSTLQRATGGVGALAKVPTAQEPLKRPNLVPPPPQPDQ
jgi:hypothetical protein